MTVSEENETMMQLLLRVLFISLEHHRIFACDTHSCCRNNFDQHTALAQRNPVPKNSTQHMRVIDSV